MASAVLREELRQELQAPHPFKKSDRDALLEDGELGAMLVIKRLVPGKEHLLTPAPLAPGAAIGEASHRESQTT